MADFHHLVNRTGGHHFYFGIPADHAVKHANKYDNAAVTVVLAVKNESFERCGRIA